MEQNLSCYILDVWNLHELSLWDLDLLLFLSYHLPALCFLVLLLTLSIFSTQLTYTERGLLGNEGDSHLTALPLLPVAGFPWACFISCLLGCAGWAACPGWWWGLQRTLRGEHCCPWWYRWRWVPRLVPFPKRCRWGWSCCSTPPWAQLLPGLMLRTGCLLRICLLKSLASGCVW